MIRAGVALWSVFAPLVTSYEWSVAINATRGSRYVDAVFDHAGNVIVAGLFAENQNRVSFYNLSQLQDDIVPRLTTSNEEHVILQRFSPLGDSISIISLVGSALNIAVGGLAIDAHSNLFVTGRYIGSLKLYLNQLSTSINNFPETTQQASCFILMFDRSNILKWSTRIFATGVNHECSVSIDKNDGSAYVTSILPSSTSVTVLSHDGSSTVVQSHATTGSILVKYSSTGMLQWYRTLSNSGVFRTNNMDVDQLGNVIWVGFTTGSATLFSYDSVQNNNPAPVTTLNFSGDKDAFLLKLSGNGDFLWSARVAGEDYEEATSVAVDSQNNIIISGPYKSNNTVIWGANDTASVALPKKIVVEFNELYWGGFMIKYSPVGQIMWVVNHTFWIWYSANNYGIPPQSSLNLNPATDDISLNLWTGLGHYFNNASGQEVYLPFGGITGGATSGFSFLYSSNGVFKSLLEVDGKGHDFIHRTTLGKFGETVYMGSSMSPTLRLSDQYTWRFSDSVNPFAFIRYVNDLIAYIDFFKVTGGQLCTIETNQAIIDIYSNEVPRLSANTPFTISETRNKTVTAACSQNICFISVDGREVDSFFRYAFYVGVHGTDIHAILQSTQCVPYIGRLGFVISDGDLEKGTYWFDLEEQYGYRANLPLNKIIDKSNITLSFTLVKVEDVFVVGLSSTHDLIEIEFDAAEIRVGNTSITTISGIVGSNFTILVQSSNVTLFMNATVTLAQIPLQNGTLTRLFVTSKRESSVRNMYMNLPESPPILLPDSTTSTADSESTTVPPSETTNSYPATTSEPANDRQAELTFLSGWILYVFAGVCCVIFLLVATLILFAVRNCRRNRNTNLENGTVLYTAFTNISKDSHTVHQKTLVNTAVSYNY